MQPFPVLVSFSMRRDIWRRQSASYPLRGELVPRFTDVDVWQHLNNTALMSMHGEAVQHALRTVLGPDAWRQVNPGLSTVRQRTDFLAEAHYPAPLFWGARIERFDADCVYVATALFQHDQCAGVQETVLSDWFEGAPRSLEQSTASALLQADISRVESGPPSMGGVANEPADPGLHQFSWHIPLSTRFSDSDARRLASDTCLARFAEQVRVEFISQVLGPHLGAGAGILVAHVSLRWLRRAAPARQWQAGCGVAHIGERSVTFRSAFFDSQRCVATSESVMVFIDRATRNGAAALSAPLRAALESYRLQD